MSRSVFMKLFQSALLCSILFVCLSVMSTLDMSGGNEWRLLFHSSLLYSVFVCLSVMSTLDMSSGNERTLSSMHIYEFYYPSKRV